MVFQLLYVSGATRALGEDQIRSILDSSRRNNATLGITGMLLHADGTFIQLLEGEQQVVRSLVTRIRADSRHRNFMVLMERNAPNRAFGSWEMGFRQLMLGIAEDQQAFQLSRAALERRISGDEGSLILDTVLAFAGREFLGAA